MQVIGLCGFSYPALGGFQVEHNSIEDRIAYLYAAARLEERFRLFETLALPSLRAQTDDDFDLILVIGDSLPPHHRDRLQALVADLPQVQIVVQPPRPQREVMKDLLHAATPMRPACSSGSMMMMLCPFSSWPACGRRWTSARRWWHKAGRSHLISTAATSPRQDRRVWRCPKACARSRQPPLACMSNDATGRPS